MNIDTYPLERDELAANVQAYQKGAKRLRASAILLWLLVLGSLLAAIWLGDWRFFFSALVVAIPAGICTGAYHDIMTDRLPKAQRDLKMVLK